MRVFDHKKQQDENEKVAQIILFFKELGISANRSEYIPINGMNTKMQFKIPQDQKSKFKTI